MALKTNMNSKYSIPYAFLSFTLLSLLSLSLLFRFINNSTPQITLTPPNSIKVYVSDLPSSFNYDLLNHYWTSTTTPDSRISSDPDHQIQHRHRKYPPYPENSLVKQYSAEYWIMGDLETPENKRTNSFAKRVLNPIEADVIFVPFFATLSAEMELGKKKSFFRKKGEGNEDYQRQKEVIEFVTKSEAWKKFGGRDHVFVLTVYD